MAASPSLRHRANSNAFSLPAPFSFDGFVEAWNLTKFPIGAAISLFVTAGTVIATILLAAFASYAIVRNWDRRFFRYSFFYLLAAMFIPFPVVALPQIQLTGILGLDNPLGVAILHVAFAMAFNTLLFTAFLRTIPLELEESMRMDGAGTWRVFWRLILPLLGPQPKSLRPILAHAGAARVGMVALCSHDHLPLARQQHDVGHAALAFAIGDTAAGYAALTLMPDEAEVMTVEMKINLLSPSAGERLVAEGRVIRPGRRLMVVTADVWAETGDKRKHVAILQGTMIPVQAGIDQG